MAKGIYYPANQNIREGQLRVISGQGENLGVMTREQALVKAKEVGLDLVLIVKKAKPPVAKLTDFRKFLYEKRRNIKKGRSKKTEQKELRLGPNISEHDLQVRIKRAKDFLAERNSVKFTMRLSGRMKARQALGKEKFEAILQELTEIAVIDKKPWYEKGQIMMLLRPKS
ncbi:MAG: translation initiation factor IF-3 [Candidatus Cloacimonetes bacterium]|nr:translation initiation factor IF-3 [Candidatus Cloacimonadota bacterium]